MCVFFHVDIHCVLVSVVHPAAILSAVFWVICSLFMFVSDASGYHITFLASCPCRPVVCLTLILIKAGDVETNTGPTTTHKQVWICNICHRQIHSRKQISIGCNRIEHWMHLSCTSIHLAQCTDTWTCHLHK